MLLRGDAFTDATKALAVELLLAGLLGSLFLIFLLLFERNPSRGGLWDLEV